MSLFWLRYSNAINKCPLVIIVTSLFALALQSYNITTNKCNLLMLDKPIKIILKLNYFPSPQLRFVAWEIFVLFFGVSRFVLFSFQWNSIARNICSNKCAISLHFSLFLIQAGLDEESTVEEGFIVMLIANPSVTWSKVSLEGQKKVHNYNWTHLLLSLRLSEPGEGWKRLFKQIPI